MMQINFDVGSEKSPGAKKNTPMRKPQHKYCVALTVSVVSIDLSGGPERRCVDDSVLSGRSAGGSRLVFTWFLCVSRLVHEVKVSGMRRHKLEIQSADNSNPNTDNFRLIVVRTDTRGTPGGGRI